MRNNYYYKHNVCTSRARLDNNPSSIVLCNMCVRVRKEREGEREREREIDYGFFATNIAATKKRRNAPRTPQGKTT